MKQQINLVCKYFFLFTVYITQLKYIVTSCFTDPGLLSGGSNIGSDSWRPSPIDGMPSPDIPPIPIHPALPGPGDKPREGSGINPVNDGSGVDIDLFDCGIPAADPTCEPTALTKLPRDIRVHI